MELTAPTPKITCAEEIFFRCSGLGYLMTDTREKSPMDIYLDAVKSLEAAKSKYDGTANKETKTAKALLESIEKKKVALPLLKENSTGIHLSESCITHLVDIFVSAKYGRKEEAHGKQLDKGNKREETSITLVSSVTKRFFIKNDQRLRNEFIQGEPDLFLGRSINEADETRDTKTSWSAHTFFRSQHKALDKNYYWQGQGYMALTGAKKHSVDFCLVNGTVDAILDEKRWAAKKYGIDAEVYPAYREECKQIEINHIFDFAAFYEENPGFDYHNTFDDLVRHSIPMKDRLYSVPFERNDEDIQRLYDRIKNCREWMNKNLFKSPVSLHTV